MCALYLICGELALLVQMVLDTQDDNPAESSPCWFSMISTRLSLTLAPVVGNCEWDPSLHERISLVRLISSGSKAEFGRQNKTF